MWEPPTEAVTIPAGDEPLVLLAPSTSQDPQQRLLRAGLEGLAGRPVRVLATANRRASVAADGDYAAGHNSAADNAQPPLAERSWPGNVTLVDWLSYARTMPSCDVVICHAGHGTLVRALACGVPVVACPAVGDMNENAARLAWAGAGVRVPGRFIGPRTVRMAVERVLEDHTIRARAQEMAQWSADHDAATTAAELVEGLIQAPAGNTA
jgi:UDP:flavonoid glycosyltransferase YjiC (YdhE family)